ncbi:MAG TPA: mannosyltransferase family protein, partial [Ktedonobacteraceae bacterium]|nr:mannosyltransferase family protein [Ktedonobacteraceae bacterium]
MKRAPISDISWLFVGTRLLLVLVTYISFILFPVPPHVYPVVPVDVTGLLTSWNRWDAVHFTQIAQFGYQSIYDTAFFPLFPLLIKGIAFLFGNQGYIAIGMILSNLALLGTLFVLYQIAVDALGEQVGRRTLLYLCIFPTAFFFFAAYNESLFLLLTASAFLAM